MMLYNDVKQFNIKRGCMPSIELIQQLQKYEEALKKQAIKELTTEASKSCQFTNQQSSPLSPVLSADELKKTFEEKLAKLLDDKIEMERIKSGMDIIYHQLKIRQGGKACLIELENASKVLLEQISESLDKLPEIIDKQPQRQSKTKQNNEPLFTSLAAHLGISTTTIQTIYEIGRDLYANGQFKEALDVFQALNHLDHSSHVIWVSLGVCLQQAKEYYQAIYAYTMANLTNAEDILPYIYTCECFLALGNTIQAKGSLGLATYFKELNELDQYDEWLADMEKKLQSTD